MKYSTFKLLSVFILSGINITHWNLVNAQGNKLRLLKLIRNSTMVCDLDDQKTLKISHYPDKTASIISNNIEMCSNYEVYENQNYNALDYNIYKVRDMKDSSREFNVERNFGFYITS